MLGVIAYGNLVGVAHSVQDHLGVCSSSFLVLLIFGAWFTASLARRNMIKEVKSSAIVLHL